MDSANTTRNNQCVIQQNNGLSSFAITRFSSSPEHHRFFSWPPRTISYGHSFASPRSNGRSQEQYSYFLDTCFLCKKPLGSNRDIFMYRGDMPFCSVECREEQIEIDETKEKKRRLSASIKALRKKEEREKSPNYPFHSGGGAVVAA